MGAMRLPPQKCVGLEETSLKQRTPIPLLKGQSNEIKNIMGPLLCKRRLKIFRIVDCLINVIFNQKLSFGFYEIMYLLIL